MIIVAGQFFSLFSFFSSSYSVGEPKAIGFWTIQWPSTPSLKSLYPHGSFFFPRSLEARYFSHFWSIIPLVLLFQPSCTLSAQTHTQSAVLIFTILISTEVWYIFPLCIKTDAVQQIVYIDEPIALSLLPLTDGICEILIILSYFFSSSQWHSTTSWNLWFVYQISPSYGKQPIYLANVWSLTKVQVPF